MHRKTKKRQDTGKQSVFPKTASHSCPKRKTGGVLPGKPVRADRIPRCSTGWEMENRTALTMLAKPVHKFDFLAGKLLGVQLLMLAFTSLLSLVLLGILFWRETGLMGQMGPDAFSEGRMVRYMDILTFGFLQWLKFGLLSAVTLFVASFSNTNIYTIIVSFCILVVCQLQYIAREAYADMAPGPARLLVQGLGLIFPNFQLFNVGDQLLLTSQEGLPAVTVLQISLYACVYIVAFLLLAHLSFRRREI